MKLNFNIYVVLIILCIGMVFPNSNKKSFHYQATLHFITGIFLYLMITSKHEPKPVPLQNNHQSTKDITEAELTCLKDKACNLSATENECNTYTRCKWEKTSERNPNGTCNTRIQCKNLDNYECSLSDYCDWNLDGKGTCNFKTNVKDKIFNEDAKANRYCFKKNPEYIADDPKGEFVEDQEYYDCNKLCKTNDEACKEQCKKEAVNRLSCNTVNGLKFKNGICRKDENYRTPLKKINPNCLKVAQHSHDDKKKDGYIQHAAGYRTPHTFKINDDQKLRFIFNIFIILFIILLNIGIIKLFKN